MKTEIKNMPIVKISFDAQEVRDLEYSLGLLTTFVDTTKECYRPLFTFRSLLSGLIQEIGKED